MGKARLSRDGRMYAIIGPSTSGCDVCGVCVETVLARRFEHCPLLEDYVFDCVISVGVGCAERLVRQPATVILAEALEYDQHRSR